MTIKHRMMRALSPLVRWGTGDYARLLMYHRFSRAPRWRRLDVADFERHVAHLRRHFEPRLMSQIGDLRRDGRWPARTVALTVDDGYADFFDIAYPVLLRYEMPATVYVVSQFIDQRIWLWFDALHYLFRAAAPGAHAVHAADLTASFQLGDEDSRAAAWESVADRALLLTQRAKLGLVEQVAEALRVALPPTPTDDYRAMTWDQVRQLDSELIEIGGHTQTHPILSKCTPEEAEEEISGCRAAIAKHTGRPIRSFCYPNGQPGDYTSSTVDAVRHAGFATAVVAHGGLVGPAHDPHTLLRLGAPHDVIEFRNELDGFSHLMAALRNQSGIAPLTGALLE